MCLLSLAGPLLLCCIAATDQPCPLLLCDHCSDEIVATSRLLVAIVGYSRLVQRYTVIVSSGK
jgi:hypothetical protein